MNEKDYSLDALNEFFDYAANKGLLKRNTAQSRKIATNKVLAVLDENEKADLRRIDVDHAFDLFQNRQGTGYTPASLRVYQSRVRIALSNFVNYVDNPANFRPSSVPRSSSKIKRESNGNDKAKRESQKVEKRSEITQRQNDHISNEITVPVPLREGLMVKISSLPSDLTPAEADKVAAIIKAYAVIKES